MTVGPLRSSRRLKPRIIAALVCTITASGCAIDPKTGQPSFKETFASDDPCNSNARNIGIAVGSVAGAIIGNQVKHSGTSRVIGAIAGAAVGGLIGADIDRRQCELYKIAKKNNLDLKSDKITVAQVVDSTQIQNAPDADRNKALGLKVTLTDNGQQFRSGSDELTPEAQAYFGQIADQYSYKVQKKGLTSNSSKEDVASIESLNGKRILLVGHTDDVGNSAHNGDLSERRAKAVAKLFSDHGISEDQLFFQGAGETLPIADNRTDDGRARNRRVEIIDLSNDDALRAYLGSRRPTLSYYRPTQESSSAVGAKTTQASNGTAGVNGTTSSRRTKAKEPAEVAASTPATRTSPSKAPAASTTTRAASTKSEAVIPAAPKTSVENGALDFGGTPVVSGAGNVEIGSVKENQSGFSVISSAHADEQFVGSCWQDRPRISHGVKSLRTGKEYSTSDYMPGLYGTSWTDNVNGNLVALTNVAVLRDGGLPASKPTMLVYRDYNPKSKAVPTVNDNPDVNVYRGDKAVLYRVFSSSAVRCMDVVIPYTTTTVAPNSRLYYYRGATAYVANFNPKIAK